MMNKADDLADSLPPALLPILADAHARLCARLEQLAPSLSVELLPWMAARANRGAPPERYFTHPAAFPLVLLPWWLDEALGGHADHALQADLFYSSMSGYYVIRLIDDVMDHSDVAAAHLLPATCVLHAEFQSTYARQFPAGHAFWPRFHETWARCHEAALAETRLDDIDEATFQAISARKVSAALIPMLAVAWRHGQSAVPTSWARLFDALCAFHQRHNDLFDWKSDLDAGARTWFLSEADRRRREGETRLAWVAREGFEIGLARLERDLGELEGLASSTGSAGLLGYLTTRRARLDEVAKEARAGLAALAPLLGAFGMQ